MAGALGASSQAGAAALRKCDSLVTVLQGTEGVCWQQCESGVCSPWQLKVRLNASEFKMSQMTQGCLHFLCVTTAYNAKSNLLSLPNM